MTPDTCNIQYKCKSVSRLDNTITDLACSDFTGVDPNGAVTNPTISIIITEEDYKNDKYKPGKFKLELCGLVEDS